MSVNLARESKDEAETVPTKTTGEAFKHLLVGEGQEGSGELLARLERAISQGDHKVAAVLHKAQRADTQGRSRAKRGAHSGPRIG